MGGPLYKTGASGSRRSVLPLYHGREQNQDGGESPPVRRKRLLILLQSGGFGTVVVNPPARLPKFPWSLAPCVLRGFFCGARRAYPAIRVSRQSLKNLRQIRAHQVASIWKPGSVALRAVAFPV